MHTDRDAGAHPVTHSATRPGEPRPGPEAAALLDRVGAAAEQARWLLDDETRMVARIRAIVAEERRTQADRELSSIPVARLNDVSERNLRIGALTSAGLRTVADLAGANPEDLTGIPGVGPHTARAAVAAAHQLAETAWSAARIRIDVRGEGALGLELVALLERYRRLSPGLAPHRRRLADVAGIAGDLLPLAAMARTRWRLRLRRRSTREAVVQALRTLAALDHSMHDQSTHAGGEIGTDGTDGTEHTSNTARVMARLLAAATAPGPGPLALWEGFEADAASYYAALAELVGELGGGAEADGMLPAELVERISAHPLDTSLLTASLRGYQAFGARFLLNQGRSLLGDEMGLGKTVQAIAAMAHLATTGVDRFLVVCPASVLVSWCREIERHSHLHARRVHGQSREEALAQWRAEGGVAVTTFESLHHLGAPADHASPPVMVVVDEAHLVKNPRTRRSGLVRAWTTAVQRVVFMTGTPLENRVEEFLVLAAELQPEVVERLPPQLRLVGADRFRREVSPIYLRRNLEDVLVELPELVVVEEWESFSAAGALGYAEAVAAGNLMAMRQVDPLVPEPRHSAKLTRLAELVEEAAGGGHRTVVFSFFRAVLDRVGEVLDGLPGIWVHGPITGSVPATRRQEIIDRFSADAPGAVLVAQIEAGGVGLNIQAASVVVIVEPQFTPAAEAQAIARVHRMGQVRTVQAHRLLVEDSVDERLEEILGEKQRLFDAYVRDSALAQDAIEAVDVSEGKLAAEVLAAEQARLGYGPVWEDLEADRGAETD